jgi:hypothetical protein
MTSFTESVVEKAALAWLESTGWSVKNGAEIAPGELFAERADYGQVVLEKRLRDTLVRLNPEGSPIGKMAENEGESHALAALYDTFLSQLISGELRIIDAEKILWKQSC